MSFGGYRPFPRRMGGGKPVLQVYHESLNRQLGTAIDASDPMSVASVQNHAIARALVYDGVFVNERLAYLWDPDRMTDTLPRWERIFAIRPPPNATEVERRKVVRQRFRRFLEVAALHGRLSVALARDCGDAFVQIEYIAPELAVVHVPDETYPWGSIAPGFPWYSTTAHMLVLLRRPVGWSEGDFYDAAAKVAPTLDPILPAWMTFDWYREPDGAPAIYVPGGPSLAGIYLDAEHNLDNHVFDV